MEQLNIETLRQAYYKTSPDISDKNQRVIFGTSGHRGNPFNGTFNEMHIEAIVQAIVDYRKLVGINGSIFLGMDSHAISLPAMMTTIEVLSANEIEFFIEKRLNFDDKAGFTPTPAVSFAILEKNKEIGSTSFDGIIITPSHNPPQDGGIKYNPPTGGPADSSITKWIESKANNYLEKNNSEVKKIPFEKAIKTKYVNRYDYISPYVNSLKHIVDIDLIKNSKLKLGVDPMGGATLEFMMLIAEVFELDLEIVNKTIDLTFSFMPPDKDGKIRMDCSSPYAMAHLNKLKENYDVAWGNDTDGDRHGIVSKKHGLLNPNHFLAVAINYLIQTRTNWPENYKIGKTIVSSSIIDRVVNSFGKQILETPVGFKHFVKPLMNKEIAFGGEESAGATFLRRNGNLWTTDKDGIIMGLLAAEIMSFTGRDIQELYLDLTNSFGTAFYTRIDIPTTKEKKEKLKKITPSDLNLYELAGEKIENIITVASNNEPIDGVKIITKNGWFAARPSGTEDMAKIYAESFISKEHLDKILVQAKDIIYSHL